MFHLDLPIPFLLHGDTLLWGSGALDGTPIPSTTPAPVSLHLGCLEFFAPCQLLRGGGH